MDRYFFRSPTPLPGFWARAAETSEATLEVDLPWTITSKLALGLDWAARRRPDERYALMPVVPDVLSDPAVAATGVTMTMAAMTAETRPRPPLPHRALARVSPFEGFPQRALER